MNISMYLPVILSITVLVFGFVVMGYVLRSEKASAEQRRKDNYRPFK